MPIEERLPIESGGGGPQEELRQEDILTPEEKERFQTLIEKVRGADLYYFSANDNWESFNFSWISINDKESKEAALDQRRFWFEMKRSGKRFEDFLTAYLRDTFSRDSVSYGIRSYLDLYAVLGYQDAPQFLTGLLGEDSFRQSESYCNGLLDTLARFPQDQRVTDAILDYIAYLFSPALSDPGRRDELGSVLHSLWNSIGDNERYALALRELAEKNLEFHTWASSHPRKVSAESHWAEEEKYRFEEFDQVKEEARLAELEKEYAWWAHPLYFAVDQYQKQWGREDAWREDATEPESSEEHPDTTPELLANMQETIKYIIQGAELGVLSWWDAVKILHELDTPETLSALESLLLSPQVSEQEGLHITVLERIKKKDNPRSIPVIAKYVEHYLQEINQWLEDSEKFQEVSASSRLNNTLLSIQRALEALPEFTDRSGYQEAERLFNKYQELEARLQELRAQMRTRLPELIGDLPRLNLDTFPRPSAEEAEEIRQLIEGISTATTPVWVAQANRLVGKGDAAIPLVYRAIEEGTLTGVRAMAVIEGFRSHAILPIFYELLLNAAFPDRADFFQSDIVEILRRRFPDSTSLRVVAEFVRRSAEFGLQAEGGDLLRLTDNVYRGLKTLKRWGGSESQRVYNLLKFHYPEYGGSYDLVEGISNLPKIERPRTKERRAWAHSKLYLRGSALFAAMLGRGHKKVKDVDIFVTNSDYYATSETMKVAALSSWEDLEPLLEEEEFRRVKSWVESHGFQNLKINLVRIPESHLEQEQVFQGEPKLLLWDQSLEGEIEAHRYVPEDLQKYREGRFYTNPEFPQKLLPNNTLARALRSLDLAERFSLEYDPTLLQQAEKAAGGGKLIISNVPANQMELRHEGEAVDLVLDPPSIKVFEDKKLRKILLQQFPRLGQLAEKIVQAGGITDYIRDNFGTVYLETRGYVRLYDVNLSKSPASVHRQKEFIEGWYAEMEVQNFSFVAMEKLSDSADLSKPIEFEEWIDQERLARALEGRRGKNKFLDKVAGRYRLTMENRDRFAIKRKIELFLSVMNLEWPFNFEMDTQRVSQTLIRLGVHTKNPVLAQFDGTKNHQVELVISADPHDLLQASLDKPWHSCVCIKNPNVCTGTGHQHPESTYGDIAGASVIAYVLKKGEFLARRIIRGGVSLDNFHPAAALEKLYGDGRYKQAMEEALQKIMQDNGVKTGAPMLTQPLEREVYADSASDRTTEGNLIYNTSR